MPIVGVTWANLAPLVADLESEGHEIVQVIESPDGLSVLYRPAVRWETRNDQFKKRSAR